MPRRESKDKKALRLIADNKVSGPAHASVYIIHGDNGTYITTVLHVDDHGEKGYAYTGTCNCKYMREVEPTHHECSHMIAARTLAERERNIAVKD